jgi:hypothetical protein
MIISGPAFALLTFPGVIMHEIAHRFMCDILQIPVYDINYFSGGDTQAGHVCHYKTDNVNHDLLIGFAPLIINSLFCMLFTLPYSSTLMITKAGIVHYPSMFLWWVGLSIGAHAFPSNHDLHDGWIKLQETNSSLILRSLCSIIKLLNRLSFFWVDMIYAVMLSIILPLIIFGSNFD